MKKISLLIIAVIAVISVVGVVSAQEQTPQPEPSTAAGNQPLMGQLLQIVANDLNLQPQDILQQMRGQTLADIIKANNGDLTKITADITAAVTARVNQAVTDGQLTQDRATQILSNLDTTIQNALQGKGPVAGFIGRGRFGFGGPGFGGQGFGGFGGRQNGRGGQPGRGPRDGGLRPDILGMDIRPLLSAVQDATKLNPPDIAQEIRGGKTLSQVITEHGGDPATVENTAIATATKRLDQVRTNGNLTQDQETAMLNGLKAFYDAVLNGSFHQMQPQPATTASAPI